MLAPPAPSQLPTTARQPPPPYWNWASGVPELLELRRNQVALDGLKAPTVEVSGIGTAISEMSVVPLPMVPKSVAAPVCKLIVYRLLVAPTWRAANAVPFLAAMSKPAFAEAVVTPRLPIV